VLRYVERNPVRAELVARAEDWNCSSLPGWLRRDPLLWRGGLKVRDKSWLTRVNEPLSDKDLRRLQLSVERGLLALSHGPGRRPGAWGSSRLCDQEADRGKTPPKLLMSPFSGVVDKLADALPGLRLREHQR
jgi:hypothetical protein